MPKFRVTTTNGDFTVECDRVNVSSETGFGGGRQLAPVMFCDTKVSGEKEISILKAVVSASSFISAVRE